MAEVINSTAKQRQNKVFDEYTKLISEKGSEAVNISKKSMYATVAKRTNYTVSYVTKIITGRFREGRCRKKV